MASDQGVSYIKQNFYGVPAKRRLDSDRCNLCAKDFLSLSEGDFLAILAIKI
jgi:hypothetical protein